MVSNQTWKKYCIKEFDDNHQNKDENKLIAKPIVLNISTTLTVILNFEEPHQDTAHGHKEETGLHDIKLIFFVDDGSHEGWINKKLLIPNEPMT